MKNEIEAFWPTSSVIIKMLLIKAKKKNDNINSSLGIGSDKNSVFVRVYRLFVLRLQSIFEAVMILRMSPVVAVIPGNRDTLLGYSRHEKTIPLNIRQRAKVKISCETLAAPV